MCGCIEDRPPTPRPEIRTEHLLGVELHRDGTCVAASTFSVYPGWRPLLEQACGPSALIPAASGTKTSSAAFCLGASFPDHNTSYPWHGGGRARRPFQKNCLSQYKARQAPVRSGLMSPPYSYQRALRLTLMAVVLLAAPSASFWGADAEDEVPATVSASGPPASGDAYPVREEGRQAVEWVGRDLSGQVVEDSQTVTG